MKNPFDSKKRQSLQYKKPFTSENKKPGFCELNAAVDISKGEMDRAQGGNTFTETERVLTFDKGY